ncbi:iron chelate uptake ABC transporter family permease subunit [Rhizobiaceae bacterium BDR2-2]|uniref:Iron chelate uptake ABC transporter family permease subunit n=1 Tax=Ectorhizobium quercum TaxID=2965071 RepID=A0AAE3MZC4_9HYPH|nr:iron chelate uptake ABC transporter family permease subunit [Ectorhizobium quercum]MCX8997241.1 iron chelate uptake ABC transporter family permease subunit [Ectorhizobium quercum]
MRHDAKSRSPLFVLALLAVLALIAIACFMTLGARGSWSFVLSFRGQKLAALVLIATAIAVSTVLFQTITGNRILTPSIMGFDALYALVQTVIVFLIGAAAASAVDPRLMFAGNVVLMVLFSLVLYRLLFSGGTRSLHLLMLVGVVFGVFFRSISGFLQRIIDPNDFVVLQDTLFASFNAVDTSLLGIATLGMAAVALAMTRYFHTFDVLSLGREAAIGLGVDYRHVTTAILVMVAILVSISTALVGPVTFFGLLVANLAYLVMPSGRHRHVLPAAVLIAVITLVGGQVVLERVFAFDTALSIVIEFAGGLFFILYLIKGGSR